MKRDIIFDFLKICKADIVFLQETHSANDTDGNKWQKEWGGEALWCHGSHHSCGVAILINPRLHGKFSNKLSDQEGRVIAAKLALPDMELNLINIYAPNKPQDRKEFYDTLWHYKPGSNNLILGGDFNCVEDISLDKQGGNLLVGQEGMTELNHFKHVNDLLDTWRKSHEMDKIYTWSNKTFTIRSRLDRFYIASHLHSTTSSCIRSCPHSDHALVEVNISPTMSKTKGRGVWKLNNSILKDKAFKRELQATQRFWKAKQHEYINIHEWWDKVKSEYKRTAISYSVRKQRRQRKQEDNLLKAISDLKKEIRPDLNKLRLLEQQLTDLVQKRLDGVKIRSRAQWVEDGEKPTKYFFELERKKQAAARITKLSTPEGDAESDEDILNAANRYYQQLYNDDPIDKDFQDQLLKNMDNQLSDYERQRCEGPIDRAELDKAVAKMHKNKAPGPDGLTIEFYQTFWSDLADDLCELFNFAYEGKHMSESQCQSLLRLLFKKGDRKNLKNWRPIALLNTDYKILSTALANRLRNVLHTVIDVHQTCGIPGRSIYDSVMTLRDIAYDINCRKAHGIFISIDQEKAFDRINRQFLDRILERLNFGPSFRQWITTIYADANCQIINNGFLSKPVFLKRGVRQGCPLSPLLYILCIEVLLIAIQKNPKITGLKVPGCKHRHKICAYADDATLTVEDDRSVEYAFEEIHRYERASGSALNMTKTEGIHLGQQAGKLSGPVPITWRPHALNILGCNIGNTLQQNWEKCLTKLTKILENWESRHLTIVGKALLLKVYGLASITYLASIFPLPDAMACKFHRAMFKFLWNNRNELVSRATCHLHKKQGGLGIPNLYLSSNALLSKWIKQIIDRESDQIWLYYARYWTGFTLGTIQTQWSWLRSNLVPHGDPNNIPCWYKVMLDFSHKYRSALESIEAHQITSKNVTRMMTDIHDLRCSREWNKYLRSYTDMKEVWKMIWSSYLANRAKEFMWKLAHRVLTTKQYLTSWGMTVNTKCPFCPGREDLHHALINCPRSRKMWDTSQGLLHKITGRSIKISLESIVFGTNLPTNAEGKHLSYYVIGTLATTLWQTRNKQVLHNSQLNQDPYKVAVHTIKSRIRVEELINPSRLDYMWSYNGAICTHSNGETVVRI